MLVVLCRLDILTFELELDLRPDLSNLEMRVHLHNFHLLLFMRVQVVLIKSNPVKNAKNDESDVVLLHLLLDPIHQVSLHACLGQILQVSLFLFQQCSLDVFRHQGLLFVCDDS